ncbi:DUF4010 domain-containing protein [Chitinophaga sp. GbtcB8]|uniref:MgtC/SapB family protein n=1 Tax=Chitinophaga sp. GbtcB8 TaxID=2824753 RepID=UPI001C307ED1|nr:DUF4010 domain-containing protein [Chitinophaga sp. GbtcB8]
MAVSIGIGMLVGMERMWSHKETGIRTFSIVALLGTLATVIGPDFSIACLIGVFLLVLITNARSLLIDRTTEITTSAALIANYILGVLVGLGHIFTPVAGAIIMTMLLAWKTELNRFAGGLQPSEIRSAILLGLIGFVIYPLIPDRYIDPWQLFNPSDAWLSIIAISGIGFVNYFLLRMFSTRGLYLGAIFGGLVNSSATVAELGARAQATGQSKKIKTLCLLTTEAMFARNLLLILLFSERSLAAAALPIIAMSVVAGLWIWKDNIRKELSGKEQPVSLHLESPIAIQKVISFGFLFIVVQIGGTLLTKVFGSYGILATGFFGGLVSSASTTAAAATMANHGKITAAVAGSVAVLSSLASTIVNLPIIWRTIEDKAIVKQLTLEIITILVAGIAVVALDRIFEVSEFLITMLYK